MNGCRTQYESFIRNNVSNPISDPMNHQPLISQKQNSLSIRTGCVSSPRPIADLALSTPVGEAMGADIPRTDPCGLHLKFPFRLHHILSEAEHLRFDHVIAWTPAGDGFRVFEPKIFSESIMQKYFGMSHYKSFQRQLSLYSFKRSTEGVNRDAYMHPFFLRSNIELCSLVPREKKRPSKTKQLATAMKQSKAHLQEQQQARQIEQSPTQRHQIRDSTSSARESGCGSIVRSSSLRNVCAVDPFHMASSHDPLSSSWVKDHDQRLTNYVQFLVFGGNTHAEQSGGNGVQGCFISPFANMENVSLEDVCDEIVKTFVS